jgi:CheY-like chemotaxis protein
MIIHLRASSVHESLSRPLVLLCVDDSQPGLLVRAHVLSKHGYEVIATDSAEQALDTLDRRNIDGIVTDYEMPGMNGGQLAACVKSSACPLPVLLHSGSTDIPASALLCVDAISPKGQTVERFLAAVDAFVASMISGVVDCGQKAA